MVDFFIYMNMVCLGYVCGNLLGWVAGSSEQTKAPSQDEEEKKVSSNKNLCNDYSHLKRYSKQATPGMLDHKRSDAVYDVTVKDDKFKINKVV